jgi:hypothetical protein
MRLLTRSRKLPRCVNLLIQAYLYYSWQTLYHSRKSYTLASVDGKVTMGHAKVIRFEYLDRCVVQILRRVQKNQLV